MLALAQRQSRDQVRGSRKTLLDILHSSIVPIVTDQLCLL